MSSDTPPLSIRSDRDVQITVYDAEDLEVEKLAGVGQVCADTARGLYRVHLDRCGFVNEHVIHHDVTDDRTFDAPLLQCPAPIAIAHDWTSYAKLVQDNTVRREELSLPRDGTHESRLFVFIRRVGHGAGAVIVPSESISIHDVSGRQLATIGPDNSAHDNDTSVGYLAFSCRIAAGTYRLRVGTGQRDLALTIPAERAAHVFLADSGTIWLRSARVYLPRVDDVFDPQGVIARAMESVLWALRQPCGAFPEIANEALQNAEHDLSFWVACAHLARRQSDRFMFDEIMSLLLVHASELPDVAILAHTWPSRPPSMTMPAFSTPPLFRASLALAVEHHLPMVLPSALAQAAKAGYADSLWCTWSSRWWDERWIVPTVERLRSGREEPPVTVEDFVRATRLPTNVVEIALARLDAGLPQAGGQPMLIKQLTIPGYTLHEILGHDGQSTVFRARRERPAEVALKIIPVANREMSERILREIWASRHLRHDRLVRFEDAGGLEGDAAVWLEMELCNENLFDHVAALRRPLQTDEAFRIVLQALEALEYLHSREIVHGNVHPGSLLLRPDGTVALTMPRFASREGEIRSGRTSEEECDALRFMAPECVLEPASSSAASDVWSMAATLYFVLTLELPRARYADQREQDAVCGNEMVPIAHYRNDLPPLLAACIERALSPQMDAGSLDTRNVHDLQSASLGDSGNHSGPREALLTASARFRDGKQFRDALLTAIRTNETLTWTDAVYDELVARDPAFAITIRNVFLRITTRVGGRIVSRPIVGEDLIYEDDAENNRVDEVLRRFRNCDSIVLPVVKIVNGGTTTLVESVSEALLASWSRLRVWHDEIDEATGTRVLLDTLGEAARSWRANPHDSSPFWNDARLESVDRTARARRFACNRREEQFLRRSRARSRRRHVVISAAAVAALAVVTGCVVWQHEIANNNAHSAKTARTEAQGLARSLQETGRQLVLGGHPFQALPYLVAAGNAGKVGPPLRMLVHTASRGFSGVPPVQHGESVTRAAFSPDGSRIVTASVDGIARVSDAVTGKPIMSVKHDGLVVSAAFSPDGKWIVTASQDRTAQVWDAATGRPRFKPLLHKHFVQSAVFSADGARVVTASFDHFARIWDARTGALEHELAHDDTVWSAAFSPDGLRVATASGDHKARLWDVVTGRPMGAPLEHKDSVWSAVFSRDGTRVVTASHDMTAQIWDAATGKAVAPPLEHQDSVVSAAFDLSGRYVVTTSYDKTARIWDASSGVAVTPALTHQANVNSAVFSADGARVVTASSDDTARLWDAKTGRMIAPMLEHAGPVTSAVFNADGTRVVTASDDGTARVWDTTGDGASVALAFRGEVRNAAFSPDGWRMVTASGDNTARIWDTATGALVGPSLVHPITVRTVAYSPGGDLIVTTSDDQTVRIWDATTGRMLTAVKHSARVTSATFSSDGARVVTATSDDGSRWDDTLHIWDISTGSQLPLSLEYAARIVTGALSPDGARLITLNQDRSARVWNAVTGKAITGPLERGGVTCMAFSPDGTLIVTAHEDRTARVWDAGTGRQITAQLEHPERVIGASFAPDGARILTFSEDRAVRIWDASTGLPLAFALPADAPIVNAAFTADGARIVMADSHGVRTWDVSLDMRPLSEWATVGNQSPYMLKDGILTLRPPEPETGKPVRQRPRVPAS